MPSRRFTRSFVQAAAAAALVIGSAGALNALTARSA